MYQTDFETYLGKQYQILRQEYDQFTLEKKQSFYLNTFDVCTRDKVNNDQTLHYFCSMKLPVPEWRYDDICLEVNRDAGWRFYLCTSFTDLQDSECAAMVVSSESFRRLVFAMFYITENIKLT